jgi:iron complex transport system ATP-binding protein
MAGRATWRVECDHLRVCRRGRVVLSDVSVGVVSDECVSLIGPNGSGKTTLLLAVAGLLAPASGMVRVRGRDIRRWRSRIRAQLFAYVPQMLERVPAFRVYDVVAGGRFAQVGALGPLSQGDEAAVETALEQCGLAALASRGFDAISGGERQKALVAAAMAQDAQVLLLDEPNTALDPAYQVELVRILRAWHQAGRGLVLVSHDLQLPAALGGRVIAMCAGCVVADGPAEQVLTPEVLGAIYGASFGEVATPDGVRLAVPAWWSTG